MYARAVTFDSYCYVSRYSVARNFRKYLQRHKVFKNEEATCIS